MFPVWTETLFRRRLKYKDQICPDRAAAAVGRPEHLSCTFIWRWSESAAASGFLFWSLVSRRWDLKDKHDTESRVNQSRNIKRYRRSLKQMIGSDLNQIFGSWPITVKTEQKQWQRTGLLVKRTVGVVFRTILLPWLLSLCCHWSTSWTG